MNATHYIIEQFTDDIYVYRESKQYLVVKRRINLMGQVVSTFFQNSNKILETKYDVFLFRKYISIEYQELPYSIALTKSNSKYMLTVENNFLTIKRKYFKNPLFELYLNDRICGIVSTALTGIASTPTVYNVSFYHDSSDTFYSLLLFLMNLPPTMDV